MIIPKLYVSISFLAIIMISCADAKTKQVSVIENESDLDTSSVANSSESIEEKEKVSEYFLSKEKWAEKPVDYGQIYIINYAGAENQERAIAIVDSLIPTFPNAGYLWIPDFESLSGKELYAVFITSEHAKYSIEDELKKCKADLPKSYIVKVSHTDERWVSYSPLDVRINKKKQPIVAIYEEPAAGDEYASDGGEDWGWFVNDVTTYFGDNHPEVIFTSIYYGGLTDGEIKKIEEDMELEGFGYVLIDGKNREFVGHDIPGGVISLACEFFGLEDKFN
jgi:hypothetical protein